MKEFALSDYQVAPGFEIVPEQILEDASDQSASSLGIDYWSLLGIYLVEISCVVVFSIYRMANFIHSKDTKFGQSRKAKCFVSMGIFMWVFPIIWVPMDVLLVKHN